MSELPDKVRILLDICSSGCIINVFPNSVEKYFPKYFLDRHTSYEIYLKAIGKNYDYYYFKYYGSHNFEYNEFFHFIKHRGRSVYCDIKIYISPKNPMYHKNTENINKLVHYLYTCSTEPPSEKNMHEYKKKLWKLMYTECFGSNGIWYLFICDNFLISDIKKNIIDKILCIEKWHNLGFYC